MRELGGVLALVEIHREDIRSLPELLNVLRGQRRRCLILCDDLSFEREDADYKALKSVLEGGIEGRPDNVLFYATSNRRHLMPRDMIENERCHRDQSVGGDRGEGVAVRSVRPVARFSQLRPGHVLRDDRRLCRGMRLPIDAEALHARAVEWSVTRGARSGRVAWQFIQDLAGTLGVKTA